MWLCVGVVVQQCQVKNIRLCQTSLHNCIQTVQQYCTVVNVFISAQGIMLVYDITQEQTYSNVSKWLRNIEEVSTTLIWHCAVLFKVSRPYITFLLT